MTVLDIILLAVHAAMAVAAVRIVSTVLAPALADPLMDAERQRTLDLWLPTILIAPFAAANVHAEWSIRPVGTVSITAPVAMALMAAGAVLVRFDAAPRPALLRFAATLSMCVGAGVILLLLAAADRLSVLVGQCAFAIWAVLLWFNSPPEDRGRDIDDVRARSDSAALATLLLLGIAVAQALIMVFISRAALGSAAVVSIVLGVVVVAIIAAACGAWAGVRLSLWSASFGVLLSIGATSLARVVRAYSPFRDDNAEAAALAAYGVIDGYGFYAPEAITVLLIPCLALTARQAHLRLGRIVGAGSIIAAAALAAWRLGGLE